MTVARVANGKKTSLLTSWATIWDSVISNLAAS
jgi:hypothetical protein